MWIIELNTLHEQTIKSFEIGLSLFNVLKVYPSHVSLNFQSSSTEKTSHNYPTRTNVSVHIWCSFQKSFQTTITSYCMSEIHTFIIVTSSVLFRSDLVAIYIFLLFCFCAFSVLWFSVSSFEIWMGVKFMIGINEKHWLILFLFAS